MKPWDRLEHKTRKWFDDIHAAGADEGLLRRFVGKIKVTDLNCDRGMPMTPICLSGYFVELFFDNLSELSKKAGYNDVCYTVAYAEHVQKQKREKRGMFENDEEFSKGTARIEIYNEARAKGIGVFDISIPKHYERKKIPL